MPKKHDTDRTKAAREQFARNLTAALDEAGVTKAELARHLKVKPGTVGDYCSGRSAPGFENLILIASIVRQSISWLCGDALHGRESLEYLQQDLAVRLGGERLRGLSKVPDETLLSQVDLLIRGNGSTAETESPEKPARTRRSSPRK